MSYNKAAALQLDKINSARIMLTKINRWVELSNHAQVSKVSDNVMHDLDVLNEGLETLVKKLSL